VNKLARRLTVAFNQKNENLTESEQEFYWEMERKEFQNKWNRFFNWGKEKKVQEQGGA